MSDSPTKGPMHDMDKSEITQSLEIELQENSQSFTDGDEHAKEMGNSLHDDDVNEAKLKVWNQHLIDAGYGPKDLPMTDSFSRGWDGGIAHAARSGWVEYHKMEPEYLEDGFECDLGIYVNSGFAEFIRLPKCQWSENGWWEDADGNEISEKIHYFFVPPQPPKEP